MEIIKLLYICHPVSDGPVEMFSSHLGWRVGVCDTLPANLYRAVGESPDLLVMDLESLGADQAEKVLSLVKEKSSNSTAAFFGLLASYPGGKQRWEFLRMGFNDVFIKPLSIEELELKARVLLQQRSLIEEVAWARGQLDNRSDLLEKFKNDLVKTRRALVKEKTLAHNALKQINIMTGERERLKAETLELGEGLRKNTLGIAHILGSMIDARNEANKGHARRVARIAMFVGERLGLTTIEKRALNQAALLHEAGLLFLPGSVSAKMEHELTEYERDLFDQAPATGAGFLNQCPGLKKAAEIISHLHENVDGSGTPHGLRRRYIPLTARILAGADLLDDLVNGFAGAPVNGSAAIPGPGVKRPSLNAVPGMLARYSGTRLDPRVVNLLEYHVVACMDGQSTRIQEMGFHQLKPGMTMGAGVYAKTGTKLFSAGAVLSEESINMLMRYNRQYPLVETVFIKVK
ncbi:MAG: HD domain-containing phosphohydrolase [Desulfobacterium sp.]|nr:HD domain-containing phosphohydrolase [Desulfobacterium sp.]